MPKRKRNKRTYKAGRLYYCSKCQYYTWRDAAGVLKRDMWNPSPSVTPTSRTCNDCNAQKR